MTEVLKIHPETPQKRLLRRVVERVREGAVIAYPTDSSYALGCGLGEKEAMERIRGIRRFGKDHEFTLLCRDLSEIATYAKVDNAQYRLLKNLTPGAYTFILRATHEVPRRLQHPKRRTIGIRVPDHRIDQALLATLGEPLMTVTLLLPGDDLPLSDPVDVEERVGRQVDVVIDGDNSGLEPTTVLDLCEGTPKVRRRGKGDLSALGL